MGMIEFKTRVSYCQFRDLEKTLMILQMNNITASAFTDEEIVISNDLEDELSFYKGDYIFFHSNTIISTLIGSYSSILSESNAEKLIKHLEENQVFKIDCPLSVSGNICKALEGK